MPFLLDTHTFLWWTADDPQLSPAARLAIADGEHRVYLSAVSGWEIAIKFRLGRLPLPGSPDAFVRRMVQQHAFEVLHIGLLHVLQDAIMPSLHNDPFDRLLVAQAKLEGLTLITDDVQIRRYDVATLW